MERPLIWDGWPLHCPSSLMDVFLRSEQFLEPPKPVCVHNLRNICLILTKLPEQVYYNLPIPFSKSDFWFRAIQVPNLQFQVLAPRPPQKYISSNQVVLYQRGGPYPSHIKNGTKNINLGQNECLFYIQSISLSFQCLFVVN